MPEKIYDESIAELKSLLLDAKRNRLFDDVKGIDAAIYRLEMNNTKFAKQHWFTAVSYEYIDIWDKKQFGCIAVSGEIPPNGTHAFTKWIMKKISMTVTGMDHPIKEIIQLDTKSIVIEGEFK